MKRTLSLTLAGALTLLTPKTMSLDQMLYESNINSIKQERLITPNNFEQMYEYSPNNLSRYKRWINETIDYSRIHNDFAVIIDKEAYELQLYKNGEIFLTFPVELSISPIEAKVIEWDGRVPEGRYSVMVKKGPKEETKSIFYKAFLIDYPNKEDKERFESLKIIGRISENIISPGSAIEIHGHGSGKGIAGNNWTIGCIAVSNEQMDTLFRYVREGTPVIIVKYGVKDLSFYQELHKKS